MSGALTRHHVNDRKPERFQPTCQVFLNLAGLEASGGGQT